MSKLDLISVGSRHPQQGMLCQEWFVYDRISYVLILIEPLLVHQWCDNDLLEEVFILRTQLAVLFAPSADRWVNTKRDAQQAIGRRILVTKEPSTFHVNAKEAVLDTLVIGFLVTGDRIETPIVVGIIEFAWSYGERYR